MVVAAVFDTLLGNRRKRQEDVDKGGSPWIGNLDLYAVFVPPHRPLRKKRRTRPAPVRNVEPSSPPSVSRMSRHTSGSKLFPNSNHSRDRKGGASDHHNNSNGSSSNSSIMTPNLSFETQKSSASSRYKESPERIMEALLDCMRRTEHSRSKLFLGHRKSFPKEILEMSDKLLHRNTTRKKLIRLFEKDLGQPPQLSPPRPKSVSGEEQSQHISPVSSPQRVGSTTTTSPTSASSPDKASADASVAVDDSSCLTHSPQTTPQNSPQQDRDRLSLPPPPSMSPSKSSPFRPIGRPPQHADAHSPPSYTSSPPHSLSHRSEDLAAGSKGGSSPARSCLHHPHSHKHSPSRVSFAPPSSPHSPSHNSYVSHHSPSRVSFASDHSPTRGGGGGRHSYDEVPKSPASDVPRAIVQHTTTV